MAKAVKEIASSKTTIDLKTGEETHEPIAWKVLPPRADHCQICATKHEPGNAHNVQSMYYQMLFASQVGRAPTWADAVAHCSEPVRAAWKAELQSKGYWSEPANGEQPVAHHGVE